MKKTLLLSGILMLCAGMVNAQKAYTYVQQNGTPLTDLGTAAFELSVPPEVTFVDGKAVMKINGNTVAELPMDNGGQLVVEFTTSLDEDKLNKVEKEVGEAGYATFYSPFQLQVAEWSEVKVYVPTYDSENHVLKCNDDTKVAAGHIIPAGTGLLLKDSHLAGFVIVTDEATIPNKGALSGSALTIPTSSVSGDVYTLGHEKEHKDLFGFFKYAGENLNAGLAYLSIPLGASVKKAVMLSFGDDADAIEEVSVSENTDGKYFENGRIVIRKAGKKYNTIGQEIK